MIDSTRQIPYQPLATKPFSPYDLAGFKPIVIDLNFLSKVGISGEVDERTLAGLVNGSLKFKKLFESGNLTSPRNFSFERLNSYSFELHDYTGLCPTNVFEINPCKGSCSASCLYCLVADGNQAKPIQVSENYPELLGKELELHKDLKHFFYFSPKTEAFSEPLLETGMSHKILEEFVQHYERYPESNVRLFIASKAGTKHINYKFDGSSVLDLLKKLGSRVQFNGSIGIMPEYLHDVLEPNTPKVKNRLEAIKLCQESGIYAYAVLSQPIIPCYLNEKTAGEYVSLLSGFGIKNIKPEFLTVNMENIAIIAQYINHFNPELINHFLSLYVSKDNVDHVKQRERRAPNRNYSFNAIKMLIEKAIEKGISVSICNWVKSQLPSNFDNLLALSEQRGFKCLGYQQKLFEA